MEGQDVARGERSPKLLILNPLGTEKVIELHSKHCPSLRRVSIWAFYFLHGLVYQHGFLSSLRSLSGPLDLPLFGDPSHVTTNPYRESQPTRDITTLFSPHFHPPPSSKFVNDAETRSADWPGAPRLCLNFKAVAWS